jgi:hypothetical protein
LPDLANKIAGHPAKLECQEMNNLYVLNTAKQPTMHEADPTTKNYTIHLPHETTYIFSGNPVSLPALLGGLLTCEVSQEFFPTYCLKPQGHSLVQSCLCGPYACQILCYSV